LAIFSFFFESRAAANPLLALRKCRLALRMALRKVLCTLIPADFLQKLKSALLLALQVAMQKIHITGAYKPANVSNAIKLTAIAAVLIESGNLINIFEVIFN